MKKVDICVFTFITVSLFLSNIANSVEPENRCTLAVGTLSSLEGRARVKPQKQPWTPLQQGDILCPGDTVEIIDKRAAIRLPNQTIIRLKPNSILKVKATNTSNWLSLLKGVAHFMSRTPQAFAPETPQLNAAIEGTEFTLKVTETQTKLTVMEGKIRAYNAFGEITATNNETVIANTNSAPFNTLKIKLEDQVGWALYYPPILEIQASKNTSPYNHKAAEALSQGNIPLAKQYLRAAQKIANKQDNIADQANTLALQSIMALTQTKVTAALQLAKQGIKLDPKNPAVFLALSYVFQAKTDLKSATAFVKKSLLFSPQSALGFARLAELQVAQGDTRKALKSIQQADTLGIDQAQIKILKGFIYLNHLELTKAELAFQQAISLNNSHPMPYLGLGLSQIHQGDLEKGREYLELAVILDPLNGLLRSYLGKAYFEEKRLDKSESQFALAKTLDPEDPTPWFYQGLQSYTAGNFLEAFEQLTIAKQRNQYRAALRSKTLLAKDLSSRISSQGILLQKLNLKEAARRQGYQAITESVDDYSSHRLLAESYRFTNGSDNQRFASLRASERLQSVIRQPLGTRLLPLGLDEAGLSILQGLGPSDFGLTEFTPLFLKEGMQTATSLSAGSFNSSSGQLQFSGIGRRNAVNLAHFTHHSDGFRENNDSDYKISQLFTQHSVSPAINLQTEIRLREDEVGDLTLQSPTRSSNESVSFSPDLRIQTRILSKRLGTHLATSPSSNLLGSFIQQDIRLYQQDFSTLNPTTFFELDFTSKFTSTLSELQWVQQLPKATLILGGGYFNQDENRLTKNRVISPQLFIPTQQTTQELNSRFAQWYAYTIYPLLNERLSLTLGAAHSRYALEVPSNIELKQRSTLPKFGASWQASDNTRLRLAAFKGLKKPLYYSASLEPTHIEGIEGIFDDTAGSQHQTKGFGVDHQFSPVIHSGFSFIKRRLEQDIVGIFEQGSVNTQQTTLTDRFSERVHQAYFNALLSDKVILSGHYEHQDYQHEDYPRQQNTTLSSANRPQSIVTERIPLSLSYRPTAPLTLEISGNFITQSISKQAEQSKHHFWILNAGLAYQFPNGIGTFSLKGYNLTDRELQLQDGNPYTNEQRASRFSPKRSIVSKIEFHF